MTRRVLLFLLTTTVMAVSAEAGSVAVRDSWFRALPGKLPAAGYFTLSNSGAAPITLTGAQSPGCGMLMLHMTHNMGGMMHMMEVPRIEVPAGGTVQFAPGGYHLMCTSPTPAMKPGANLPVSLGFADGQKITASFTVRNATGQ